MRLSTRQNQITDMAFSTALGNGCQHSDQKGLSWNREEPPGTLPKKRNGFNQLWVPFEPQCRQSEKTVQEGMLSGMGEDRQAGWGVDIDSLNLALDRGNQR